MKTILLLLNLLFAAGDRQVLLQSQPAGSNENNFIKLSVLIDPGLGYIIEDSAALSIDNTPIYRSWDYDRNNSCRRYTYDSLVAGNYTFYTRDFWGRARSRMIALQHDTAITIPVDHYQQVNVLSADMLKQADTIKLFYSATGCFLRRTEKVSLIKDKRGKSYTLTRTQVETGKTDTIFRVPAGIVNDLNNMVSTAGEIPNDIISTTQQSIWILADNKLFHYYDQANKWKGYSSFMGRWLKRKG